MSKTNSRNTLP